MSSQSHNLILIGTSCRAAAQCAAAFNLPIQIWDMYADRDTEDYGKTHQITGWNDSALDAVLSLPKSFLLPCGGLENQPQLWSALAAKHILLGPISEQLALLRDPRWLQQFCERQKLGVRLPTSEFDLQQSVAPKRDSQTQWLIKSYSSCGGLKVRNYAGSAFKIGTYLQERIGGDEFGVIVNCRGEKTHLIAATRPIESGHSFKYQGSVGPVKLPPVYAEPITDWFTQLALQIDYTGVLQADVIATENCVYLLEINPRWTAAMELVELSEPGSILRCFSSQEGETLPIDSKPTPAAGQVYSKQIIFADREIIVNQAMSDELYARGKRQDSFWLADLPKVGTKIELGQPVYTVARHCETSDSTRSVEQRHLKQRLDGDDLCDARQQ